MHHSPLSYMSPKRQYIVSVADAQSHRCDFCGGTQHTYMFEGPDRLMKLPGRFTFVRCNACGLVYQWPQLPWNELKHYYEGDYVSYAGVVQDEPTRLRRVIKRVGTLKQRWYIERFCRKGRLLDVGCGTGVFLAEMQQSGRWDLMGLEPTFEAAAYARQRLGVPVIEQPFEQADLPPNSQDVITMWHVLEHMTSPRAALAKAWELLKPGGYLIFSIPNYESLSRWLFGRYWIGWDLPRHLFLYPRPTLMRMMQEHNFVVVDHRCFLITYHSLGLSLRFWTESWPKPLDGLGRLLTRLYHTPVMRIAVFPLQLVIERLGLATVTTWTVQKVDGGRTH